MLTKLIRARRVSPSVANARRRMHLATVTDGVRLHFRADFIAVCKLTWPIKFQITVHETTVLLLPSLWKCMCLCCRHTEGPGKHYTHNPFLAALASF